MTEISFTVPGQPIAKGRPKFARRGNFVTAYNPAKTVNYEGLVAHSAMVEMIGKSLIAGPISVQMDIRLQIPESWSKRKKELALSGLVAATKRPDLDNIFKALADGMNGVVFKDDCQIVQTLTTKKYAETPGVYVVVRELDMVSS